jgi:uncharacterized membrane protein
MRSSHHQLQTPWPRILTLVVGFWFAGSLVLDGLIMPSLYAAGMMREPGFVLAGHLIFSIFNRIELLSAAVILTALLALRASLLPRISLGTIALGGLLLLIASVDTYILTPEMSGLGLQLNVWEFEALPPRMMHLQYVYWLLEGLKWLAMAQLAFGRIQFWSDRPAQ